MHFLNSGIILTLFFEIFHHFLKYFKEKITTKKGTFCMKKNENELEAVRKTTVIGQRKIISKCRHILGIWQRFLDKIGNVPEILWAHLELQEIINTYKLQQIIKTS
ncbi:uncharacterized protein LOC143194180 [Rhynchophorus ferrugineus]|uniref:uncharacterized protein LOC143194180 n=1 Tax=Rhynchophorus ferrugineus TaxID=354439 RepID=UPI003FCDDAFD